MWKICLFSAAAAAAASSGKAATLNPREILQSFSHFAYNAPDCVGNNYYNTTFSSTWCEDDYEYPSTEIETAIMYHFYSVAAMYKVKY